MSVILTAGFDKAKNALALATMLHRDGVAIKGVLVVNPFNVKRLRAYVRQRGAGFVVKAFGRLRGNDSSQKEDAVSKLLKDEQVRHTSLKAWAAEHDVPYKLVDSLNGDDSISFVTSKEVDWLVYAGGGILRKAFINAARERILNAHAGPLPQVRGMNACEWSLLLGQPPHVTVHLINRGIDTGGIFKQYPVAVYEADTIEALRARSTAVGIRALHETVLANPTDLPDKQVPVSRQCFVLAPALKELLEQRLARGDVPGLAAVNKAKSDEDAKILQIR